MPDGENGITWSKLAQIILPIILTAFLAVLGLMWNEIRELRVEVTTLKVQQAVENGKLCEQLGRQEVTVKVLAAKIDAITITKFRGDD